MDVVVVAVRVVFSFDEMQIAFNGLPFKLPIVLIGEECGVSQFRQDVKTSRAKRVRDTRHGLFRCHKTHQQAIDFQQCDCDRDQGISPCCLVQTEDIEVP